MTYSRRDTLTFLSASIAGATLCVRAGPAAAAIRGETSISTKHLPPFELQGSRSALAGLAVDVTEYYVQRVGRTVSAVWLRGHDGQVRFVSVDQRDALPMFEVFTLGILTLDELQSRWRQWKAPVLPDDMPEQMRTLMTTKPAMPTPPQAFEAWPFDSWRTQVLRRAEFIVENVRDVPTLGQNPNMQSASRPASVPSEASASCEVDAGLLFIGNNGHRLLLAVDWMPLNMIATGNVSEIAEYLAPCEAIDLDAYLERNTEGRRLDSRRSAFDQLD